MTETTAPQAPTKRKRRWPKVLLVLLVLLIVLVLCLPMLLSTAPARNYAVGKINDQLNGSVSIADWSIGWTSGIHLRDVRVFDDRKAQIAQIRTIDSPLSLIGAARGNIDLGKTVVDGVTFDARFDEAGQLNFARLVKTSSESAKPKEKKPAEQKSSEPADDIDLPNVKGQFVLSNVSGKIEHAGLAQTAVVRSVNATVDVPDINQQITADAAIEMQVADGRPGTIALKATADIAENNELDVNTPTLNATADVKTLDLASLSAFLPPDVKLKINSGTTNGQLVLAMAGGKSATLKGNLTTVKLAATGEALKGDTFTTDSLTITIPQTTVAMPNGPADTAAMTLNTADPIKLTFDQGSLTASADAAIAALINLANRQPPGSAGKVNVVVNVNAGRLAKMLPNTLSVPKGTVVETGQFNQMLNIDLQPDVARVVASTRLTEVAGTRDGKAIAMKPITVDFNANVHGSAGPLPDVRDAKLVLQSGFADATFTAPTLTQLNGNADARLDAMQAELGQFVDFKGHSLAGAFNLVLNTTGDPADLTKPAKLSATATLTGVKVAGQRQIAATEQTAARTEPWTVQQSFIEAKLTDATLQAKDNALQSIRNAVVTIVTGEPNARVVDGKITNINVDLGPTLTASWTTESLTANLTKLARELSPLVPALRDLGDADFGMLTVKQTGTYSKAGDGSMTVAVKGLSVTQSEGLLSVTQSDGEELKVALDPAGKPSPGGKLNIAANLLKLNEPVQRVAEHRRIEFDQRPPELSHGTLEGTLDLANVDGDAISISLPMTIKQLSIVTSKGETDRQDVTITLASTVAKDFTSIRNTSATARGSFGDVNVSNVALDLPKAPKDAKGTALPRLKSANILINVMDFGPLDSLRKAFAVMDEQTLRAPRGSLTLEAAASQTGDVLNINVTRLQTAKETRLQRGGDIYHVQPIDLKTTASINLAPDADKTVAEQIRSIAVDTLQGTLGVATIAMPQKIVIDSPGTDAMSASGAVNIDGKLQHVTPLLAFLQGKKPADFPYTGDFALSQTLSTNAGTIRLKGEVPISNFQMTQDGKPVITERRVDVQNEIAINPKAATLAIENLKLDMPESKTVLAVVKGKVSNYTTARQIEGGLIDLTLDWAKLWTVIKPLVPAEKQELVADLQISGQARRVINIGGSFPADLPFEQAIKSLYADGSIFIERLQWQGCDATGIERPFVLKNGVLALVVPGKPEGENLLKGFQMNGGVVLLDGMTVDLTQKTPRLSTLKGLKLVQNVSLTPALSNRFGKLINNPLFVDPKKASGILDVTFESCDNLPLGELVTQRATENNGSANIVYSVKGVHIGNQMIATLLQIAGEKEFADSMQGDISQARVSIANGAVQQDTTITVGEQKRPLRFAGGVTMADQVLRDFRVNLPREMLQQAGSDLAKYLPEGFDIPLEGKVSSPKPNVGNLIGDALRQAAQKAALDAIVGKKKDEPKAPADPKNPDAKPEEKKPDDPIGTIFDAIKQREERERQKKEEKKRREQEAAPKR